MKQEKKIKYLSLFFALIFLFGIGGQSLLYSNVNNGIIEELPKEKEIEVKIYIAYNHFSLDYFRLIKESNKTEFLYLKKEHKSPIKEIDTPPPEKSFQI